MRHVILYGLLVLHMLVGSAVAMSSCPKQSLAAQIKAADVIMVVEKVKHDFVGYGRAGLKRGKKDMYAAKHKETPLWKWKINEMEVKQILKGAAGETTRIVSSRNFSKGGKYIIFAKSTKGMKRYKHTKVPFVSEKCDAAEFIYPVFGSDLLDDVEDYLSKVQFK